MQLGTELIFSGGVVSADAPPAATLHSEHGKRLGRTRVIRLKHLTKPRSTKEEFLLFIHLRAMHTMERRRNGNKLLSAPWKRVNGLKKKVTVGHVLPVY